MYYDDDYNDDLSLQLCLTNFDNQREPNSFLSNNSQRNSCINFGNEISEINHNENNFRNINIENEINDNNNNENINIEKEINDNNNNENINIENEIIDNNNNENNLNISENDFKEENLKELYQNFYEKECGFFKGEIFNDDKIKKDNFENNEVEKESDLLFYIIKDIYENNEVEMEYNLLFDKLFSDEKEKKDIENLDEFNFEKKNNENSLSHKQQNSTNSNSNSKNRNYSQSINKRESNSLNLSHNPNIFSNNSICCGVFNKDNNIIPRIIQGNKNSNLSSDNDIMQNNDSLLFSNSLNKINKNSSLSISFYINENQNKSQMISFNPLHKKRKKDSKKQQIDERKNRSQDCIPIKKKREIHDKYETKNMIKKIKTYFFRILINKFNEKLKSVHIESLNKNNALYPLKILPINYNQKKEINKVFNINLLSKAFKTILSEEVTGRYDEKKKFHNKDLIDYLVKIYNEESLEKKEKLKKLIDFLNMKMENFFDIFEGKNIDTIFESKDEFLGLVNKELEKEKDNNYKKIFLENLMNFPSLIKNIKPKKSTKVRNKRKTALFMTIQ